MESKIILSLFQRAHKTKISKAMHQKKSPLIQSSQRSYSKLAYAPHEFSIEEARKKLIQFDKHRLFAPTSTTLTPSDKDLLKAALVPLGGIKANIVRTKFEAEIGKERVTATFVAHGKGGSLRPSTVTDWSYVNGQLGSHVYTPEEDNMLIYFGETYYAKPVEEVFNCKPISSLLQPFDISKISQNIYIDPWKKVEAYGIEIARQRIAKAEEKRVESYIRQTYGPLDHMRIKNLEVEYAMNSHTKPLCLNALMLPMYVFSCPNTPDRFLAAIFPNDTKVTGIAPVSPLKVSTATTIAMAFMTLFAPEITIPVRIFSMLLSAIASGVWAQNRLYINRLFEEAHINAAKKDNARFTRSQEDENRFAATIRDNLPNKDSEAYQLMGLDPNEMLTEEKLRKAFAEKIMKVHADRGGSDEETRKVIEARNKLRLDVRSKSFSNKRYYSTISSSIWQKQSHDIQHELLSPKL